YARVLLRGPGPYHAGEHASAGWAALKRQTSRLKADYVRADLGGGRLAVISTVALPGSSALAPEDAVRWLGDVLRSLQRRECAQRGKQTVTSSRGWKPPARRKGERLWERVQSIEVRDPAPVAALLRECGLAPVVQQDGGDPLWTVS